MQAVTGRYGFLQVRDHVLDLHGEALVCRRDTGGCPSRHPEVQLGGFPPACLLCRRVPMSQMPVAGLKLVPVGRRRRG